MKVKSSLVGRQKLCMKWAQWPLGCTRRLILMNCDTPNGRLCASVSFDCKFRTPCILVAFWTVVFLPTAPLLCKIYTSSLHISFFIVSLTLCTVASENNKEISFIIEYHKVQSNCFTLFTTLSVLRHLLIKIKTVPVNVFLFHLRNFMQMIWLISWISVYHKVKSICH